MSTPDYSQAVSAIHKWREEEHAAEMRRRIASLIVGDLLRHIPRGCRKDLLPIPHPSRIRLREVAKFIRRRLSVPEGEDFETLLSSSVDSLEPAQLILRGKLFALTETFSQRELCTLAGYKSPKRTKTARESNL